MIGTITAAVIAAVAIVAPAAILALHVAASLAVAR